MACHALKPLTSCTQTIDPNYAGTDKAQTGERSRNPDGTLTGADRSTAQDADFWDLEDVYRHAVHKTQINEPFEKVCVCECECVCMRVSPQAGMRVYLLLA